MTSLDEELTELRRWKPHSGFAGLGLFERLVTNEFLSNEEQRNQQEIALSEIIRFSVDKVPYYRDLFKKLKLRSDDVKSLNDLPKLPILDKNDVIEKAIEFRAESLPKGDRISVVSSSSGTTGRPVKVVMTQNSNNMFSFLWHRNARWSRFDPMGTFAEIRLAHLLPRHPDGKLNPDKATIEFSTWRYMGQFFETGKQIGFNLNNSIEEHIKWLKEYQPDYLLSNPGTMEEIAFAHQNSPPAPSLKFILSTGTHMTPSMERHVQRVFEVPISQIYGLNEIGMVALRCEEGRYHIHAEHCIVEIVDDDGVPCPVGTIGRIVVTGLSNYAMPLFRYDTGDVAEAVEGLCLCGRTLPSIGSLAGRVRRFSYLPKGTRERINIIAEAIEAVPNQFLENLRQYQIYQDRNNCFELRIRTAGVMAAEFNKGINEAWKNIKEFDSVPFSIVEVEKIMPSPSGKVLDFVSDYYPDENQKQNTNTNNGVTNNGE